MPIHVTSETGPLKKVLLHRPGLELEHLTPTSLEQLLFDDIPYLAAARREHDAFAQALTDNGVEVVYLEKLMAETISNRPELRKAFDTFLDGIKADGTYMKLVQKHYKSAPRYLPEFFRNVSTRP